MAVKLRGFLDLALPRVGARLAEVQKGVAPRGRVQGVVVTREARLCCSWLGAGSVAAGGPPRLLRSRWLSTHAARCIDNITMTSVRANIGSLHHPPRLSAPDVPRRTSPSGRSGWRGQHSERCHDGHGEEQRNEEDAHASCIAQICVSPAARS
jgi:hypothetical protein